MGDKTAIEWSDATWNPTTGCDRVSAGCDHCYALDMAARLKAMGSDGYQNDGDPRTSGPGFALTEHDDRLAQPMKWKRPRRIFVNSMSDLFHPAVTDTFLLDVWQTMAATPRHTYQVLTKRPQAMWVFSERLVWMDGEPALVNKPAAWGEHDKRPLPNVWLGTSIETDRYAFRADFLRKTPAAVRFLSLEPLLGPLPSLDLTGIDWVIVGGESGPGARPMHPQWARDIRDRCVEAGVPLMFKQWGAWSQAGGNQGPHMYVSHDGTATDDPWREDATRAHLLDTGQWRTMARMTKMGKHDAGRELDGRTWDEYPA